MRGSQRISSGSAIFEHTLIETPSGDILSIGRSDAYELIFITSGVAIYSENTVEYRLGRGALIFLSPTEKRELSVLPSSSYEMYSISFTSRDLVAEAEYVLNSILSSCKEKEAAITFSYAHDRMISVFERFECADGMPRDEKAVYFKMLISEIMILLSIADNLKGEYEGKELGARVARYLDDNIDRDVSLDSLARRFFVSKYYLCRAFKKYNGISVHSYINNKRVTCAKQLIESGESASSAAYKVGFGDYSSFYRAYVKIYGRSPTLDACRGEDE